MIRVEQSFRRRGITRGGTLFLEAEDALELVRLCRERGVPVLGVDGVRITEQSTQPDLRHSVDFSEEDDSGEPCRGSWAEAERFLRERIGSGLFFEVVLGDFQ